MREMSPEQARERLAQALASGFASRGAGDQADAPAPSELDAARGDLERLGHMLDRAAQCEHDLDSKGSQDLDAAVKRGLRQALAEQERERESAASSGSRRWFWLLAAVVVLALALPLLWPPVSDDDSGQTVLGGGSGFEAVETFSGPEGNVRGILLKVPETIPDFEATIRVYRGDLRTGELDPARLLHTVEAHYEDTWDLPQSLGTEESGLTLVIELRDALSQVEQGQPVRVFLPPR